MSKGVKHLEVPMVVALMYNPKQTPQIPPISEFEYKMSVVAIPDLGTRVGEQCKGRGHEFRRVKEIPNISNLETAPYGEICDQDVDQPFEYSRSQTMQHIPDDVYDTLLNNVLYARINENSKNDIADDSEDPDPIPKKRSRKKVKY